MSRKIDSDSLAAVVAASSILRKLKQHFSLAIYAWPLNDGFVGMAAVFVLEDRVEVLTQTFEFDDLFGEEETRLLLRMLKDKGIELKEMNILEAAAFTFEIIQKSSNLGQLVQILLSAQSTGIPVKLYTSGDHQAQTKQEHAKPQPASGNGNGNEGESIDDFRFLPEDLRLKLYDARQLWRKFGNTTRIKGKGQYKRYRVSAAGLVRRIKELNPNSSISNTTAMKFLDSRLTVVKAMKDNNRRRYILDIYAVMVEVRDGKFMSEE